MKNRWLLTLSGLYALALVLWMSLPLNAVIWSGATALDPSWQYFFIKLRDMPQSLGVDYFHNYGPLSSYLLGNIGLSAGPHPALMFVNIIYLVLFAAALGYFFWRLKQTSEHQTVTWLFGAVSAVVLPCLVTSWVSSLVPNALLLMIAFFAVRTHARYLLPFLSLCSCLLMLTKFSAGLGSALLVIPLILQTRESLKFRLGAVFGHIVLQWLSFFLVTNSWDLTTFIFESLIISSEYAENMVTSRPGSAGRFALILSCCAIVMAYFGHRPHLSLFRNRWTAIVILAGQFLLWYKAAFTRSDFGHQRLYFDALFTLYPALFWLFLTRERTSSPNVHRRWNIGVLVSTVLCVPFTLFWFDYWVVNRIKSRITLLSSPTPVTATRKFEDLNKSYRKALKPELRDLCTQKDATLVILPVRLGLAHYLEDCKHLVLPSIQTYINGPQYRRQYKDVSALKAHAPEYIYIEAATVDRRNSLAEFSVLLPTLLNDYQPIPSGSESVLLERAAYKKNNKIVCNAALQHSQPNVFHVKMKDLSLAEHLFLQTLKLFHRFPQFKMSMDGKNASGDRWSIEFRLLYGQARHGFYASPHQITEFIPNHAEFEPIMVDQFRVSGFGAPDRVMQAMQQNLSVTPCQILMTESNR